jgi:hypothetical protein
MKKLMMHYRDHIAQLQHKKLQQAIVEQAVQAAGQLAQSGALQFPAGLFGNAPQLPAGNPEATGPFVFSGHDEGLHGNS